MEINILVQDQYNNIYCKGRCAKAYSHEAWREHNEYYEYALYICLPCYQYQRQGEREDIKRQGMLWEN